MGAETANAVNKSLFDQFANTEVTVFGITDTISNLSDMCPVPVEQRSLEAMDRFTAKVLHVSGIEVPPEYSHLLEPDEGEAARTEHAVSEDRNTSEAQTQEQDQLPADELAHPKARVLTDPTVQEKKHTELNPEEQYYRLLQLQQDAFREVSDPIKEQSKESPAKIQKEILSVVQRPFEKPVASDRAKLADAVDHEKMSGPKVAIQPPVISERVQSPKVEPESLMANFTEHGVAPQVFEPVQYAEQTGVVIDEVRLEPDVELQAEVVDAEVNPDWIDELIARRLELAPVEAPTPVKIVLAEIIEAIEMEPEAIEQTEAVLVVMPENVQDGLIEFLREADPEEALPVQELVVQIGQAADRLHELSIDGKLDGEEAVQIELLIREWYEELLVKLDIEVEEEAITRFIEMILSEEYSLTEHEEPKPIDEGLHERKHFNLMAAARSLTQVKEAAELDIARLMVRYSTRAANFA